MALFKQVTIVGLGLIGGSLGMAMRRRKVAHTVVGLSRKSSTLRVAKRRGAIDVGTLDARQAVRNADLVILAIPVDLIVPHAMRLARMMRPGSVLMDVGSTKAEIVRALDRRLSDRVLFVGAHPIAGSEQHGIEAADSHLFDRALCVLTPSSKTNRHVLARATRFWKALTCDVSVMSPAQHDRVLAATSHLPHLMAYALASAVNASPLRQAPRSVLDMTRLAQSDPDLWDDIFFSNRAELLRAMQQFERSWGTVRRHLTQHNRAGLRQFLARAQSRRHALQDH